MPAKLVNRATGERELIEDTDIPAALASGKYLAPDAVAVHRFGQDTYVSPDVAQREQAFTPAVDPARVALAQGHAIRERENSGVGATVEAGLGGAVSGLSFGLLDPFQDAQEFHPIASGLGQVAGAVAPAFVGDLGGLLGLGRDAALADDALSAERAASSLSSKFLYGGETAAEGAAGAVERHLANAGAELAKPPLQLADLGELDSNGLAAARKAELEAIDAARQPDRDAFVKALREHNDSTQAEELWNYTSKHPSRVVRGLGKESREADIRVRGLLKNEVGLARNPEIARDALERQAQALAKIESEGLAEHATFQRDFAKGPRTIRQQILDGKLDGYVVGKGGLAADSPLIDQAVEREMVNRFGTADLNAEPTLPARLQPVMDSAGLARVRNQELRASLEKLAAEPASPRLAQIDAAKAALGAPRQPSLGEQLFHGAAQLAGPAGVVAEKAWSGIRKLVSAGATRASKTAASFVDSASNAASKALPHVPMVSSRVLASVAFAPSRHDGGSAGATAAAAAAPPIPVAKASPGVVRSPVPTTSPVDLATHYQKRTDEIRALTAYDATGNPVMRPEARMAMASRLDAIRAASPMLADRMETVGARRIEYLASIIPKLPDYGTMSIGPDRRRTPDMEMRSFARAVAAVERPHEALERLVHGTMTPQDAQALRAVYPEEVANITRQITTNLPTLRKNLPYRSRLALSIFTGVPVDVAMTPGVLRVLQGMYAAEPGTAGGTQAPRAQPQFGSVKRSDPGTAAQRRQGLK